MPACQPVGEVSGKYAQRERERERERRGKRDGGTSPTANDKKRRE